MFSTFVLIRKNTVTSCNGHLNAWAMATLAVEDSELLVPARRAAQLVKKQGPEGEEAANENAKH